jgi:hypothetical protein
MRQLRSSTKSSRHPEPSEPNRLPLLQDTICVVYPNGDVVVSANKSHS